MLGVERGQIGIGDAVGGTEPVFGLLPPGVAFLAGGLVVLAVLGAWELRRRQTTA